MRIRKPTPKVSREVAATIVAHHNGIALFIARKYTDSELKEVLKQLKLKGDF